MLTFEYGHSRCAVENITGVYGIGPNDFALLRDLAATGLARGHFEYHNADFILACSVFKRILGPSWGLHVARNSNSGLYRPI